MLKGALHEVANGPGGPTGGHRHAPRKKKLHLLPSRGCVHAAHRVVLTRHGELDADDVELVVDLGRGVTWAFAGALAAVLNEIKK